MNPSPSITNNTLNLKIMGNMISDMFTLIGILPEGMRYSNNNHLKNSS